MKYKLEELLRRTALKIETMVMGRPIEAVCAAAAVALVFGLLVGSHASPSNVTGQGF